MLKALPSFPACLLALLLLLLMLEVTKEIPTSTLVDKLDILFSLG